jgi:hypothetical protein
MAPNELKALLAKTKEVALRPKHVEVNIPNHRNKRGAIVCPIDLVRATVIEDGYPWVERREISACGDQTYDLNRKNGVLVEIAKDDFLKYNVNIHISGAGGRVFHKNGKKRISEMTPYPHTHAVHRDRETFIRMIVSRKAIFSSWGEYALDQAKRQKEEDDEQAKYDELKNPQAEIMGLTREELNSYSSRKDGRVYLGAEWIAVEYLTDEGGNAVYKKDAYGWARKIPTKEIGKIEITLEQAIRILGLLTPKQKRALKA